MSKITSLRWHLGTLFWAVSGAAFSLAMIVPVAVAHPFRTYRDIKEAWDEYDGDDSD